MKIFRGETARQDKRSRLLTNDPTLATEILCIHALDKHFHRIVVALRNNTVVKRIELVGEIKQRFHLQPVCRAFRKTLAHNSTLLSLKVTLTVGIRGGWNHPGMLQELMNAIVDGLLQNSTLIHLELCEYRDTTYLHYSPTALRCVKPFQRLLARPTCALQSLSLPCFRLDCSGGIFVGEGLQLNKSLQTLHLENNGIGSRGLHTIGHALAVHPTLQNLHLNYNGLRDISPLAVGLASNAVLRILDLAGNNIGCNATVRIAESLLGNNTLEELNLKSNKIRKEGAEALGVFLAKNNSLTSLDLAKNRVGSEGVAALAVGLATNTKLLRLSLACNDIWCDGVRALAEIGLRHNSSLVYLNLDSNVIRSNGSIALTTVLLTNPGLQELSLCSSGLDDASVAGLSVLVREHQSLHGLYLDGNDFTDDGLEPLAQALATNYNAIVTLKEARFNEMLAGKREMGKGKDRIAYFTRRNKDGLLKMLMRKDDCAVFSLIFSALLSRHGRHAKSFVFDTLRARPDCLLGFKRQSRS